MKTGACRYEVVDGERFVLEFLLIFWGSSSSLGKKYLSAPLSY
jgi:hypothetical protein